MSRREPADCGKNAFEPLCGLNGWVDRIPRAYAHGYVLASLRDSKSTTSNLRFVLVFTAIDAKVAMSN